MNCPACGNPVGESDHFCPKCYARIEPPGLWQKLLSLFKDVAKAGPHPLTITKSVTIKTVGRDGVRHEYHSLDDVPPKMRSEIEALEGEAEKVKGNEISVKETSHSLTGTLSTTISRKDVSVYKIVDAKGVEHIYHSLDEIPPDIRAAIEQAEGKLK